MTISHLQESTYKNYFIQTWYDSYREDWRYAVTDLDDNIIYSHLYGLVSKDAAINAAQQWIDKNITFIVHYVSGGWHGELLVTAVCGQEVNCMEASMLFTNCSKCKTWMYENIVKPVYK